MFQGLDLCAPNGGDDISRARARGVRAFGGDRPPAQATAAAAVAATAFDCSPTAYPCTSAATAAASDTSPRVFRAELSPAPGLAPGDFCDPGFRV